ncbi:hypothetical protein [Corynebacterium minutissimum]|uniref:Scaffolding protein n=1 Tax=Corynebacterium minutissimum TaxID=38301 RepID=A0A376CWA1_9CORY|nr:hypothetical protein [Corynebacterium minutissimum]QRP60679.1 hypothetical protein I6J26_11085 [Corynebacterium minutissimum]STC76789.1 Uncharacterised protein [Corynebacterium minutissimum]
MSDEAQTTKEQTPNDDHEAANTPPWGDEEFNAEKAWNLIQNLREDKTKAQERAHALTQERDQAIAGLTERDSTIQELQGTLALAEDNAKQIEADHLALSALRHKENLLLDAGLDRKFAENVVGDTPEEWEKSVNALFELTQSKPTQRRPDPAQATQRTKSDPIADLSAALFSE